MRFFIAILLAAMTAVTPAFAQTDTTFTYQGQLDESGSPADGFYSMSFKLFDALSGGSQVGSTVSYIALSVEDGLFNAQLDFGAQDYGNEAYWLEIEIAGSTLAPRVALTASPFSIQTRGINVADNGFVGIGTDSQTAMLEVDAQNALSGTIAIYAKSADGIGIYGISENNGVRGHATASTGVTFGVYARNDSTAGYGVYGYASQGTGETYGVYGRSNSASGQGVFGLGTTGVSGQSFSTSGIGVRGEAASSFGITYGVLGISESTDGRGVVGEANSTTGFAYGVLGISESTAGIAVYGRAKSSTGHTSGVYGTSSSTLGRGVYGVASALSGTTYGVYGLSSSSSGYGLYGEATRFSGITYGCYAKSDSISGRGMFGYATSTTGVNYGVIGRSDSASGFDFYAGGAGANYGATSSRRWKNNIVNIDNPLDKLAQLRGVYFDWDEEHGGQHDLGMIAEEVGKVLPEIVNYEEDGVDAIGMDYSKMTPLLVEALNALRAEKDTEIEELRNEIATLKGLVERIIFTQHHEDTK